MQDMILILNFSDEFAREVAKRLRAEQVYSRIAAGSTTSAQIREIAPRGIILCGEPRSAAGVMDGEILKLNIPILALGHTAHMVLAARGGACAGTALENKKANVEYGHNPLFAELTQGERYFQEALTLMLPADLLVIASACGCTIAYADEAAKLYGIQFELEHNDPEGTTILKNFARDICACTPWYTVEAALREAEHTLNDAAAQGGYAVCAVSGGVDSTVAAVLTHRAFGERMMGIFVETGLMREGEGAQVQAAFEQLGIPLRCVDRSGVVLDGLAHKRSMTEKRDLVFSCLRSEMIEQTAAIGEAKTLVLGTNYSDFLGGAAETGWMNCGMTLLEPLRHLLKDEVRTIAALLGLSEEIVRRKPFPLLGLGARIVGEVTVERLHALRTAEAIFAEEIRSTGMQRKLYKYFPVLIASDPVQGSESIVLRAVTLSGSMLVPARLPYDLVERTVQRIRSETPSVSRIFYDQTPTPLGEEAFA